MAQKVKVSVNLAEQDVQLLEQVSKTTGMSLSEVIRHAIGLERLAQEARTDKGKKLLFKDGSETYQLLTQ